MEKLKQEKEIERVCMKVLKWADAQLQDSQNQPKTQNNSSIKNCTYQDDNVKIIFRHNF